MLYLAGCRGFCMAEMVEHCSAFYYSLQSRLVLLLGNLGGVQEQVLDREVSYEVCCVLSAFLETTSGFLWQGEDRGGNVVRW